MIISIGRSVQSNTRRSAHTYIFPHFLLFFGTICTVLFTGCEIFHLGGTQAPTLPDLDQTTAQGTLLLFKAELDSNNVAAATRMLATKEGTPYLAIEKYELRNEIARLGRRIAHQHITALTIDTLSPAQCRLHTEFNYMKEVTFTATKLDNLWFIVSIEE